MYLCLVRGNTYLTADGGCGMQIFYYADFFVKNEPPSMERLNQVVATVFV